MKSKREFNDINVGDAIDVHMLTVSQAMIDKYAEISGDYNPIHVDVEAASKSEFKGTIAHGCIPIETVMKGVCQWMGRPFFGGGSKLRLRYLAPSRPGDTIRNKAVVEEKKIDDGRKIIVIGFTCENQNGASVVAGTCEIDFSA